MSSDEEDLFGENEDEDMDQEDVKEEETGGSTGLMGRDDRDDVIRTDQQTKQEPYADSARNELNGSEAADTRIPHAAQSTTRSRQSSRSPGLETTTHNLAPQSSSAAYQRRMNILPRAPVYDPLNPPTRQTLSLDPTIVIPHPCATHALAATPCLSYLLTGNQDGYVRAWDFWASANSGSALSAVQRGVANLGEGVNKAGVAKGYWRNDAEVDEVVDGDGGNGKFKDKKQQNGANDSAFSFLGSGQPGQADTAPLERKRVKRLEPVYSLAVQSDGLWSLSGTESGPINLVTLRHAPGTIVHALQGPEGHTKAVSAMCLSSDEASAFSGSWDQTVKQWDLNTGQVVRTFTKHRGQISTIQLRPTNVGAGMGNSLAPSLMVGSGSDERSSPQKQEISQDKKPAPGSNAGDVEMDDAQRENEEQENGGSDYDSLFGDEDGEKQDGDVEEQPATERDGVEQTAPAQATDTKPVVTGNSDFPFNGAPPATVANSKPALGKPTNPFSLKPNVQAKQGLPTLTPAMYRQFSDDVMLVSAIDGEVALHDRRVSGNTLVGKLESSEKTPPWCMSACFSSDGQQVIAGRRNASLDVWDIRRMGRSGTKETPNLLRTLKHPATSGYVSCVAAFPDAQHIAVASVDCVRLWNTSDLWQPDSNMKRTKSGVPFRIVAGHHGGTISSIYIDPTGKYMITASGNRGWFGDTTKVVLVHERK